MSAVEPGSCPCLPPTLGPSTCTGWVHEHGAAQELQPFLHVYYFYLTSQSQSSVFTVVPRVTDLFSPDISRMVPSENHLAPELHLTRYTWPSVSPTLMLCTIPMDVSVKRCRIWMMMWKEYLRNKWHSGPKNWHDTCLVNPGDQIHRHPKVNCHLLWSS